ncbi:DNA translocase FtsK [Streptomyces atratus]|uniref:DNA translocase FtsK n=1 Tax=Streptomyces atratus TaxID=1893 RepID=UPI00225217B7|nr:DNA translocase FtsK [Streptomyces atratus]MCX5338479.1 hypothetical protein [Streptomyces atratus]MCX5346156.1 hypothetical protein [Streptomyces atratus]
MSDPVYDEARVLASQLGEGLSQSALQRRLRLGHRQARQIMDRLEDEGLIGPRERERQGLLADALERYAQALSGCALYESSGTSHLPLHGWSCHQDAAQVARDARETAVAYGATPEQMQAADRTTTDNAGQRLIWAARALHPQGDS